MGRCGLTFGFAALEFDSFSKFENVVEDWLPVVKDIIGTGMELFELVVLEFTSVVNSFAVSVLITFHPGLEGVLFGFFALGATSTGRHLFLCSVRGVLCR